jgi:hypothetical protein
MPIVVNVDQERREVRAIAAGLIGFEDVKGHLVEERHFGGLAYRELLDARGAGIAWSPSEVRQIVALIRYLGQQSKLGPTAVLVSTDVAFGMFRMLEALVEDVCEVKPFWNEDEAVAWLVRNTPAPSGT